MLFSPHGNINFTVLKKAIVNRPSQAFNTEGIEVLFDAIFNQVEKAKLSNWFLIEVLGDDALTTDKAVLVLSQKYALAKEKGCLGIKGVVANVVQKDLLERISINAKIHLEFYENETQALNSLPN